jgi:hypothetical protein
MKGALNHWATQPVCGGIINPNTHEEKYERGLLATLDGHMNDNYLRLRFIRHDDERRLLEMVNLKHARNDQAKADARRNPINSNVVSKTRIYVVFTSGFRA